MDLGKKVRDLRIKNNLTLDELASRCELSKGFLSQLENNMTSPSFSTLEDIVLALGTTLELFFKEEKNEQIIFSKDDYFIDVKDDSKITWIVPNAQKNEMEPIILELKPNGTSKEILSHEGEEFGYCLKGSLVILNNNTNEKNILKKGDTFYFKGNFPHTIINESNNDAAILWVCSPPIF